MRVFLSFLLAGSLALAGCAETGNEGATPKSSAAEETAEATTGNDTARVAAAIDRIHVLYNEGDFGALYALATDQVKRRLSKEEFLGFMQEVRGKLGAVRSSEVTTQSNMAGAGKREVVVKVRYENDEAPERWTLFFGDQEAKWSQFNFTSTLLRSGK